MARRTSLVFTFFFCFVLSCKGDLAEALNPLFKPDLASARVAVENLKELAEITEGDNAKVEISEISDAIQNLYRAEVQISKAIDLGNKDEKAALVQDKASIDWLQGTALNKRGNPRLARAAKVKAMNLRKTATDRTKKAQNELIAAMKAVDEKIKILFEAEDIESTYILHGCVETINVIYLKNAPFKQSIKAKDLDAFKKVLSERPQLLSDAEAAEKGGNYEKALALFSKAKDKAGVRRSAYLFAKDLEEAELFGEASEKYELAGKFADSKRLRDAHPELINKSFTSLSSIELFQKVKPAILKIKVFCKETTSHGTGFFYKRGGYILTNRHVIRPTVNGKRLTVKKIVASTSDNKEFDVKVLAFSPLPTTPDLAVIKIELEEHDVLRIGEGIDVANGTEVAVVGYPTFIGAKAATINTGIVSMNAREVAGKTWIETDATTNGGNSGGPLLLSNGSVIGVVTAKHIDKDKEGTSWAIPIGIVTKFLERYRSRIHAE